MQRFESENRVLVSKPALWRSKSNCSHKENGIYQVDHLQINCIKHRCDRGPQIDNGPQMNMVQTHMCLQASKHAKSRTTFTSSEDLLIK